MRDSRTSYTKTDLCFLGLLSLLLLIFYPDLFLAKSASLAGDHWEQHYPWASFLSQSLKSWRFPFWTSLIGCGFPIGAEGQIGFFYMPNLLLHFFLPLKWAYSYQNVLHFLLSGFGTYLYARQVNLVPLAAMTAAVAFLFGTAYGGAYYNITSLKTISWFPVSLFLIERLLKTSRWRDVLVVSGIQSLVISQMIQAGYLQVAAYALLFVGLYAVTKLALFPEKKLKFDSLLKRQLLALTGSIALALVVAAPQILLTYELALHSNRLGAVEEYAYVGSMFPLALSTFVYPLTQGLFRGNSIYIGTFSVLLVLFGLYSKQTRKDKIYRTWLVLGTISLLLALGEWSPLYVAIIKLTHFYSFRTPAKFLVFICFSLALLSAFGLQTILKSATQEAAASRSVRRAAKTFNLLITFIFFCITGLGISIKIFRNAYEAAGHWFVRQFFYGRMGHPHDLSVYQEKFNGTLDTVLQVISPLQGWPLIVYAMLIIGVSFSVNLLKSKKISKVWIYSGLVFLILDLYFFSWYDIRKDILPYSTIKNSSPIVTHLEKEWANGNVGRLTGVRKPHELLPLVPSANMLHNIQDIGLYSPLVTSRYHESIGRLGNVNDSNIAHAPSLEYILARLPLLNLINVSHVLTVSLINHPNFVPVAREGEDGPFLYRNTSKHDSAHFFVDAQLFETWNDLKEELLSEKFPAQTTLLLEEGEINKVSDVSSLRLQQTRKGNVEIKNITLTERVLEYEVSTEQPGFFMVSNLHYPGWYASLANKPTQILKGDGLFMTVWLPSGGPHHVKFYYVPFRSLTEIIRARK